MGINTQWITEYKNLTINNTQVVTQPSFNSCDFFYKSTLQTGLSMATLFIYIETMINLFKFKKFPSALNSLIYFLVIFMFAYVTNIFVLILELPFIIGFIFQFAKSDFLDNMFKNVIDKDTEKKDK